ncbi:hypothetical protein FACS1894200_00280 [Spirochaetia bacterium]|nr:hypothetical protein FACS1894200_00280 [Spirochaetia bacterium]
MANDELNAAIKEKNIFRIRNILTTYIINDKYFSRGIVNEKIGYCEKQGIADTVLFEEFDGKELITDENKWTDRYYAELQTAFRGNFSKVRLEHLKKVANRLLNPDKSLPPKANPVPPIEPPVKQTDIPKPSLPEKVIVQAGSMGSVPQQVHEQPGAIVSLIKLVNEQTSSIESLKRQVNEQSGSIEFLKNQIKEQSASIDSLEKQIKELVNPVNILLQQIKKYQLRIGIPLVVSLGIIIGLLIGFYLNPNPPNSQVIQSSSHNQSEGKAITETEITESIAPSDPSE